MYLQINFCVIFQGEYVFRRTHNRSFPHEIIWRQPHSFTGDDKYCFFIWRREWFLAAPVPRDTLNLFLRQCQIQSLGRSWLQWDHASARTRQRYVQRSGEIVSAVLKVVSPDNAPRLWKELQTSSTVNRLLGLHQASLPSETAYLEELGRGLRQFVGLGYTTSIALTDGWSSEFQSHLWVDTWLNRVPVHNGQPSPYTVRTKCTCPYQRIAKTTDRSTTTGSFLGVHYKPTSGIGPAIWRKTIEAIF